MDFSALIPDSTALRLEEVTVSQGVTRLVVSSNRRNGVCPSCGKSGARIHSHYQRKLQDLPWQGITVSVLWRSRKVFCDTPGCPRRVFTERLPLVAAP
jgi:transposase